MLCYTSVAACKPDDSISGWDTRDSRVPAGPDLAAILAVVIDAERPDFERILAAEKLATALPPNARFPQINTAHGCLDIFSRIHAKGWLAIGRDGRAHPSRPVIRDGQVVDRRIPFGGAA